MRLGRHVDTGRQGIARRFLVTSRHVSGLILGGLMAHTRGLEKRDRRRFGNLLLRFAVTLCGFPVNRELRRRTFPVQLRRRLEMLGPTYIKLGQILAMREDLLPKSVTDELKHLLDRLPGVPYDEFHASVSRSHARHSGRSVEDVFAHIRTRPLGSASIGQVHLGA